MNRKELTTYTNALFKLYIDDVLKQTGLKMFTLNKQLGLPTNTINSKVQKTAINFVSLPFLYLIANHTGITFDLLKYDKIHKENLLKSK
jgi:hypothetical protein